MIESSKSHRLVETNKRLAEVRRQLADTKPLIQQMLENIKKLEREEANLENTLNNLIPKEMTVTDHATIRYAERHYGLDVAAVKKEVLAQVLELSKTLGCNFTTDKFVVRNNAVVTYLPEKE